MNQLNLHTLEKHEKEPVQNLIDSAYIHGCDMAKKYRIKWRNSIRTQRRPTKKKIFKPVFFRIVLQHKHGSHFDLHLYQRVEYEAEYLVGKMTIKQDSDSAKPDLFKCAYVPKMPTWNIPTVAISQSVNLAR